MKKHLILAAMAMLLILVPASGKKPKLHRGLDSLEFRQYAPLKDKPVMVYTYIPTTGKIADMPVLIAMHGAERKGMTGIICWREFAERDGFIVISPQFTKEYYKENDYQFGGVIDRTTKKIKPEEEWTYSIIEPIFDYIKKITGNKAEKYNMQGHSAGGQFTHRYLMAKPHARVDRAVACNPGSWTWCNPDGTINGSEEVYTWPYSVHGTPFADKEHLEAFFARNFWVCLGSKDCNPDGKAVPKGKAAKQQGDHRLMRGQNFYAESKKLAEEMGVPFNWDIKIVEGIGHQGRGMVYGKRVNKKYSADNYTETAAWYLIFGSRQQ